MPKPKLEFRPKPPAPSSEEVERFISQGADTQTPKRSDVQAFEQPSPQIPETSNVQTSEDSTEQVSEPLSAQASKQPDVRASEETPARKPKDKPLKGPGLVQRQSGVVRRRMTIYLAPELAQSLQISSVHEGRELSEIVSDALTKYLSRKQASKHPDV